METSILRQCHPLTPAISNLYRQCRNPARTKHYYQLAKKERDHACFPYMLKEYTRNVLVERPLRRLRRQALFEVLCEGEDYHPITAMVLAYLPFRFKNLNETVYSIHIKHSLQYDTLRLPIRFQQMSGRLVELGRPPLQIPTLSLEEVEFQIFEKIWYFEHYTHFPSEMISLYRQLGEKRIRDKWRVMLSHIKHLHFFDRKRWTRHCQLNHADYFLAECLRLNPRAHESLDLLEDWVSMLKYPSCYKSNQDPDSADLSNEDR